LGEPHPDSAKTAIKGKILKHFLTRVVFINLRYLGRERK
jgi:hypothetical protein